MIDRCLSWAYRGEQKIKIGGLEGEWASGLAWVLWLGVDAGGALLPSPYIAGLFLLET